jgi:hypothetical protein
MAFADHTAAAGCDDGAVRTLYRTHFESYKSLQSGLKVTWRSKIKPLWGRRWAPLPCGRADARSTATTGAWPSPASGGGYRDRRRAARDPGGSVNDRGRTARVHDPRPLGTTIRSCAFAHLTSCSTTSACSFSSIWRVAVSNRSRKLGFATRALPTAKTRPESGVGSPTLARRPGRPASVLVALALAFPRSRLDPRHAGGRGEEGRVTVVPTDSQAWRLFLEHLFDHAPAPGLADPLRLDHDHVSRVRPHAQPHLLLQLEAGL